MAGAAVYTKIEGNRYHHRMVALEAGATVPTHRHRYPHTATCLKGEIRLWAEDGGEQLLAEGESRDVPAGIAHEMEFLSRGAVLECVHVLRREDGSEVPYGYVLTPREQVALTGLL